MAGQWDKAFVEAALRAGQRQARIGVDPRWHAGSHAIVVQGLIRGIIRDGVEAALRTRRGPLSMLAGDPVPVLAATEMMAEGLATLVSAVVLDLDLTFSGYIERLRLDAEAALSTERGRMKRLVTDSVVEEAMHEPPDDTRAYFRGRCLSKYADSIAAASWDSVIFDLPGHESLQRVPTIDPLRGSRAHVGELLDRHDTALGLFEALTAR